jgi:methyl-accepting chemotaxis protein
MLYREAIAILAALRPGQSIIEYQIDGTILDANEKFLSVMGYRIAEIIGKHHGIFVEPFYRDSRTYRAFWEKLRRGEPQKARFKRIARNGREIWFDASYNLITDARGQPFKVVTLASDIAITTIPCWHADRPRPDISGRVIAGPASCRRA